MSTIFIPFLEMNGRAKEAIEFYEKALDAKLVFSLPFDSWNKETELTPEQKNMIGYAVLKIGEAELQLTDHVTGSDYHKGTQISLVVQTSDKAKAYQYFEALKEDGTVNQPISASPFSPAYGNVTDKFGITFRVLYKK